MRIMHVQTVSAQDDLAKLVREINSAKWDDDNAMPEYSEEALVAYIQRADTLFLTCYEATQTASVLLGIASARVEMKPYGEELWLYVDEVDVCADQRRKGAGKQLMQELIKIAEAKGCEEVLNTNILTIPLDVVAFFNCS